MEWYREVLKELQRLGFEPTPAEAVYLREVIAQCFEENDRIEEKVWNYYLLTRKFLKDSFGIITE